MDPTELLIYQVSCATILGLALSDASIRTFITIKLNHVSTATASLIVRSRLGCSLAITRRSFRNDWIGRGLRAWELRSIRANPAYAEFFEPRPEPLQEGQD